MTTSSPSTRKKMITTPRAALVIPLCVLACFGVIQQGGFLQDASIGLTAPAEAATPRKSTAIPVTITRQGPTTRVIFDLATLTPYVVHKKDGGAEFVFRTSAVLATPSGSSDMIGDISVSSGDGSAVATISLKPGSSYKHYRLQKKVVIDITDKSSTAASEATAKTEPPKSMPDAKAAATDAAKTAAAQQPVPPAAVTTVPEKVSSQDTTMPAAAPGATPAAAPVTPVTTAPIDHTPTNLHLETLEPVKIAVFTRYNALWIVVDTISAAIQPPTVSGPLAEHIGKPRSVSLDGGIAFKYALPQPAYVTARKENMGWTVSLTPSPVQAPSDIQANVEFDGGKAKIVLPFKGSGKVLKLNDPDIGDTVSVIAANAPSTRVDQARHFPNLDIIPAAIGVAVKPLSDDIQVNRIEDFVLITAPGGIIATPAAISGPSMTMAAPDMQQGEDAPVRRLFDFPNWRQGGAARLYQNITALQNQIAQSETPEVRNELLLKIALLYFANNMGQETLGVLRILEQDDPELFKSPTVLALRGVASAMANHYTDALSDLTNPALQQNPEARLWIGTAAAATEQWQMANREFPKDNRLLAPYPENIAVPITIYMAESALRLGHTADAQKLLDTLKMMPSATDVHNGSAIAYLRGEIARQEGRIDDAIRIWKDVSIGIDRLYHTKASLALANIQLQQKMITPQAAADQVDSLRFAWRGDGLEVQIIHDLGLMKTQAGKFLEGLQDLKSAVALADSMMIDSDPIKADITRAFNAVFAGNPDQKIPAIEAVSVYNEFNKLVPAGEAGAEIRLRAAEFMISIDLLGKAAGILEDLFNTGMVPPERIASTGAKLAAVYLLDDKPEAAIATLDKTASSAMDDAEKERRALLMARAQSQMNNTDQAIQTLSTYLSADAQKLKVDVLWRARRWAEAGDVLLSILPDPSDKNFSDEQSHLVVNAAVACKLAGNSVCLQNMRSNYAAAMAGTKQATTFTVITREGGASTLADRDTILKIAGEADLFKQFLESYKSSVMPASPSAIAPDTDATTAPPAE